MEVLKNQDYIKNDIISASQKTLTKNYSHHGHIFFEMEFVIEGTGIYEIDGVEYEIRKNTLFFMSPANIHALRTTGAEIINIMFTCDRDMYIDDTVGLILDQPPCIVTDESGGEFLKSIFLEMVRINDQNPDYAISLLRCALYRLGEIRGALKTQSSRDPYISKAIIYIQKNFSSEIDLKTVAAEIGWSEAYFCDMFHKRMGVGFKSYLDDIRFSYAKKLLKYTSLSVKEVHFKSGFYDYTNFSRRFKMKYGICPTEYRALSQAKPKKV